jgi:hypothetical protein
MVHGCEVATETADRENRCLVESSRRGWLVREKLIHAAWKGKMERSRDGVLISNRESQSTPGYAQVLRHGCPVSLDSECPQGENGRNAEHK